MADKSKIAWTDATWNPVLGCRKVSAGCDNCYAIKDAHRLASAPSEKTRAAYQGLTRRQSGRLNWTGTFREVPDRLDQPLRWTKPRRIFANSMSDLFGEGISDAFIYRVFGRMAVADQHQFQILTKRPERMMELLGQYEAAGNVRWGARDLTDARTADRWGSISLLNRVDAIWKIEWPLPNVWLGVSCEDQKAADGRIPLLLQTPAVIRFLSCEPLLGPVDLSRYLCDFELSRASPYGNLHWVIVGGESGPGARPMDLVWVLSLIDQCREAGVPLFLKQWGSALARDAGLRDHKGGDPAEWPEALRIREYPEANA